MGLYGLGKPNHRLSHPNIILQGYDVSCCRELSMAYLLIRLSWPAMACLAGGLGVSLLFATCTPAESQPLPQPFRSGVVMRPAVAAPVVPLHGPSPTDITLRQPVDLLQPIPPVAIPSLIETR